MSKILLILLLLAAFAVVVVRWQGRQYQAFMEKAEKISATVTRKETKSFRPNQQTGKENWVSYRYNIGGTDYSGEEKIEYADLWHTLAEGQSVEVYYNKNNPGESHLAMVLDRRLSVAGM